tara:strand:+ start:17433 stop:19718 length:2286 start_codon:yes stop_codon:yes gene_type:complete
MANTVKYILDIQSKKAADGLKKVSKETAKTGIELNKAKKSAGDFKGALKKMAVGGAVLSGLAVSAGVLAKALVDVTKEFYALTKGAVDAVNRLNDLSTASNLAATTINAVEFAFIASGQSMDAADTIMKKFPHRMKEIHTEGSTANEMMKILEVEIRNLDGTMRDSDSVFRDIIASLQNMADAELKTQVATELFRRDAGNLMVALGNSAPLENFISFTEKYGVNAKKSADQAAEFQRSLAALSITLAFLRDKFIASTGGMNIFKAGMNDSVGAIVFLGTVIDSFAAEIKTLSFNLILMAKAVLQSFMEIGIALGKTFVGDSPMVKEFIRITKMQSKLSGKGSIPWALESLVKNMGPRLKEARIAAEKAQQELNALGTQISKTGKSSEHAAEQLRKLIGKTKELNDEAKKANKDGITRIIFGDRKDFLKEFAKFDQLQTRAIKGFQDFRKEFHRGEIDIKSAIESADQFMDLFKEMGLPRDEIINFINLLRNLQREMDKPTKKKKIIDFVKSVPVDMIKLGYEGLAIKWGEIFEKKAKVFSESHKGMLGKMAEMLGAIGGFLPELASFGKKTPEDIQAEGEAFNSAIANGIMMLPEVLINVLPKLLLDLANKLVLAILRIPSEVVAGIMQFVDEIVNSVIDFFRSPVDNIKEGAKSTWEWVKKPFADLLMGGGRFRVPHGEGGLRYTGASRGLAMLHEGEVVIPRSGQASQGIQRRFGGDGPGGMNIVINSAVVDGNVIETLVRQIEEKFEAFGSSRSSLFS